MLWTRGKQVEIMLKEYGIYILYGNSSIVGPPPPHGQVQYHFHGHVLWVGRAFRFTLEASGVGTRLQATQVCVGQLFHAYFALGIALE